MGITVAVSGINAADNPGPGTGIARSLKESGLDVRVIGLAYDTMEPGIFMDWLIDKSYILPYPSGDTESYLKRLAYINEKESVDILISALDAELPLFISLKSTIESMGIKMLIPDYNTFMVRDKSKLETLAPEIGLKSPGTLAMTSVTDIDKAASKYGFPMMIKGPFYEAVKVKSVAEAQKEFYTLSAKWGFPIIAQEFITGEEYNLIGLGDGEGNDLGHLATKKMMITKLGKVWTNVSIINKKMFDASKQFISKYKWSGGYELELIQDAKTDELYLIEINPRFPAWLYMATGCGINLPERMVKLLMGQEYETHSKYDAGKTLIRYTGELIRSMKDFENLTMMGES